MDSIDVRVKAFQLLSFIFQAKFSFRKYPQVQQEMWGLLKCYCRNDNIEISVIKMIARVVKSKSLEVREYS